MNKEEFLALDIDKKINYLNERLSEGETVTKIRESIGIGEKALQKHIKECGYKYNNKTKQYSRITDSTTPTDTQATTLLTTETTTEISNYLIDNFSILKDLINNYKATTTSNTLSNTNISINLINDKHLNPKPHSLRVNEFVWEEWQKFCEKNKYYSKQDLLSMAMKEYMEKYND